MPEPLIALLQRHHAEQDTERAAARQLWQDEGWVFADPLGAPLNHNSDYHEWKRLLKAAGLRETRLHDARHTAATVLLILRQPERTVMSLMGWSSADMTRRYQHVTDSVRADVANQVGGLIWEARSPDSGNPTVFIRRSALAVILPLVEDAVLQEGPRRSRSR
ncbi:MAG TPA: tyrosine-type recombinase/integrase [Jiangellaceae bacterium]